MPWFTFYKPETGRITVNKLLDVNDLPANQTPGELYVSGFYSPLVYDIINEVPVEHGRPNEFGPTPPPPGVGAG